MSQQLSPKSKRKSRPGDSEPTQRSANTIRGRQLRETIESFAIAFILAFIFRAFEGEFFVIPTGSMAPTLMGRHKELLCPTCGFSYWASASEEADRNGDELGGPHVVVGATCPMCRHKLVLPPSSREAKENPSYNGDRILVNKLLYAMSAPDRWDVIVFRFPEEAQLNYIKRLVGLPQESVRIYHGDIYIRPEGESQYTIARKPPSKVRAMAQIVYDNDYVVDEMSQKGWPVRWQPAPGATDSWTTNDGSRTYQTDGASDGEHWLRYLHFVPTEEDWKRLEQGPLPAEFHPKPQLITDFYAYNSSITRGQPAMQPQIVGLHWVGDLLLECQLEVQSNSGTALLDLVQGGRHFRCAFDVAKGRAELSIVGLEGYHPMAQTSLRGPGTYRVAFANVDQQLLVWVNDSVVSFDRTTAYEPLANDYPQSTDQDPGDLAPVGIGSQKAALRVSHQRVRRDIYYIADRYGMGATTQLSDYHDPSCPLPFMTEHRLAEFFSSPNQWKQREGRPSPFDYREAVTFDMGPDQFFVLGDNSPASADARLWRDEQFVARDLLIGKALCVYWPHSLRVLVPFTDTEIPFVPYFKRMGAIH